MAAVRTRNEIWGALMVEESRKRPIGVELGGWEQSE